MYLQIISRCDNSLRTEKGGSMYCLDIVTTGMEMGFAFTSVPPLTIYCL